MTGTCKKKKRHLARTSQSQANGIPAGPRVETYIGTNRPRNRISARTPGYLDHTLRSRGCLSVCHLTLGLHIFLFLVEPSNSPPGETLVYYISRGHLPPHCFRDGTAEAVPPSVHHYTKLVLGPAP